MGSQPIGISASRGAAILGLSKWKTQVEAWLEIMEEREPGFCAKHNYAMPEPVDNAPIRWGKAFENAVIELAEREESKLTCGNKIIGREKLFTYQKKGKNKPTLTCHVDGFYDTVFDGDHPQTMHEGKTTNEWTYRESFGEPGTDAVPLEYQVQCQHQLICTGAEEDILSVLCFPKRVDEFEGIGYEIKSKNNVYRIVTENGNIAPREWAQTLKQMGYFHQYTITPNEDLQQKMIAHYTDFWQNNVLKQIPPEPINIDDIKLLYRDPVGTVIASPHVQRMVSELRDIQSELGDGGSLKKRVDQLKCEIMKFIVDSEKITDDDSLDKYILRDDTGKKLISYAKNKNGTFILR